jgi:hypothetical protein
MQREDFLNGEDSYFARRTFKLFRINSEMLKSYSKKEKYLKYGQKDLWRKQTNTKKINSHPITKYGSISTIKNCAYFSKSKIVDFFTLYLLMNLSMMKQ